MKKRLKLFVALGLAVMMCFVTVESTLAYTYNWAITKSPGVTGYVTKQVEIPFFNDTIYFDFTTLSGQCDYCVVQLESANNSLYYINNTSKNIRVTRVGAQKPFVMEFVGLIDMNGYMKFKFTLENDAEIGVTLSASGTLSY